MDRELQRLTAKLGQLSTGPRDDLLQSRKWQLAEIPGRDEPWEGRGASLSFTVASYNILSQSLLEEHSELYEHLDSRYLTWNHRRQKLLHELNTYQPDIICLQEVELEHYEEFFSCELEARGYEGVYKKRTNNKVDGCAMFYKGEKFICEKVVPVEYYRPDMSLLNRDNIGLVVLLRSRNTSLYRGKLCIATTHLLYNPRRGDIKLAQLMLLLAKIDEVAHASSSPSPQYHPIILCGDLNLEPNSDLYLFLSRNRIQYEGLMQHLLSGQTSDSYGRDFLMQRDFLGYQQVVTHECQLTDVVRRRNGSSPSPEFSGYLKHHLNLISAYPHFSQTPHNCGMKEATSAHEGNPITVDYIFYSVEDKMSSFRNGRLQTSNVQEGSLSLVRVLGLLTVDDFKRLGSLPTRNTASDHLILLAEFCLHR